jgi:four helix bundle protein
MTVQRFCDLRVWQSGKELVVGAYELTRTAAKSDVYGLSSQSQRAVVSVPANIAEGHNRRSLHEYLQFLAIARSSLAEVEMYPEQIPRLGYASRLRVTRTNPTTPRPRRGGKPAAHRAPGFPLDPGCTRTPSPMTLSPHHPTPSSRAQTLRRWWPGADWSSP